MMDYNEEHTFLFPVKEKNQEVLEEILEKNEVSDLGSSFIKQQVKRAMHSIDFTSSIRSEFIHLSYLKFYLNDDEHYKLLRKQVLTKKCFNLFNKVLLDWDKTKEKCSENVIQEIGLKKRHDKPKSEAENFFYLELFQIAKGSFKISFYDFEVLDKDVWLMTLHIAPPPFEQV